MLGTGNFRKNTIGGFNRADVLSYINDIQFEIAEKQSQYKAFIEGLQHQNHQLIKQCAELTEVNELLSLRLAEREEKMQTFEKVSDDIENEQKRLAGAKQEFSQRAGKLEKKLLALTDENRRMTAQLKEQTLRSQEQSGRFDSLQTQHEKTLRDLEMCREQLKEAGQKNAEYERRLKSISAQTGVAEQDNTIHIVQDR
ncbi:MAG: hypothetical protein LBQ48_06150, partial [Oscillospiraceae bacterium]|nr:hypothetical protein [Oscillospiraceae bacterium]